MDSEDLYDILGVSRGASEDEIRRAYRKLARKHHPDLNPRDANAEDRFKRVSAAYEVLSNEQKRALYDEFGADAEKIGWDPEKAEQYRQWKQRADAAAGFGGFGGGVPIDLEDLFGDLWGARRGRGPRRGRNIETRISIAFRLASLGGAAAIEVPSGGAAKRLNLNIPAGIQDGQRLRLSGKGMPSPDGGPAGDLYVTVHIEEDPRWTREGLDLHQTVPISVPEALIGGPVEVETLTGQVKLSIKEGAQNGQRMRLRGKGIQASTGAQGDMIVTLEVTMPAGGDRATRERIAKEFEALYEGSVRARS